MQNIFVIGLDDFNLQMLKTIRGSEEYSFHGLLDYDQVVNPAHYPIEEMITAGNSQLDRFEGGVDAIVGHWDFPSTALMAIFREHRGLGGPSLASVLISEHKYWSRLRAEEAIPDHIPPFEAVDPFAEDAAERIALEYPFWLKPVIGFSTQLAFKIGNRADLDKALVALREGIGRFGEPFGAFLPKAELPADIPKHIDGYYAIAERAISGDLSTAEGFIREGMTTVYGIVDSYREGPGSSFSRYQVPSRMPREMEERVVDCTRRIVPHLGLDNTPFNIEYFWDAESKHVWLLEINPRLSKSHSPLFVDISGASNHEVAVEIALGCEPQYPRTEGGCAVAAKFMLRCYDDARVTRVPLTHELEALEAAYAGTRIEIAVEEGQWLSDLRGQDAYSFEVAIVFMGADDTETLMRDYERLKAELPLEFDHEAAAVACAEEHTKRPTMKQG